MQWDSVLPACLLKAEPLSSKGRTVSGSACGFQLLFFIPVKISDRYKRAYAELFADAGPGYHVTDIYVSERRMYGVVGTRYCADLKATAYPQLKFV